MGDVLRYAAALAVAHKPLAAGAVAVAVLFPFMFWEEVSR